MYFTSLSLISVTAILSSLASAAPTIRTEECPVETIKNCSVPGKIALTFDDGPGGFENDILQNLGDRKATFFLNGCNSRCIYDEENVKQIRALHAAQHTLGSHGWSHAHMNELTYAELHNDLGTMEDAFVRILGLKPLYFRAPYGEVSDTLITVLAERGYKKIFRWTDDIEDAMLHGVEYAESVYKNISVTFPEPHMVLNHAPDAETAREILPYAIEALECKGYELVSVDTCIGGEGEWPYVYVGEPQERDDTWHC